jgi:ssDNA-binding Zn-finger/Zn-ribbon topoisomerase 1
MKNRSVFGWKISESRIVSVSELESGIQTDVVCPCCGDYMVAAHSDKGIASYLRHQSGSECRYSYETQLHISAKAFIERVSVSADVKMTH